MKHALFRSVIQAFAVEIRQHGWRELALISGILSFLEGYKLCQLYSIIALTFFLVVCYLSISRNTFTYFLSIIAVFFLIGQLAISYREQSLNTFILEKKLSDISIEAEIEKIEENRLGKRLYLINLKGEIPKNLLKVRVNSKQRHIQLEEGMIIKCTVTLMPPQEAAFPGGFNTKTYLCFKEIGATGYITSNIKISYSTSEKHSWISQLRKTIQCKINNVISSRNAAIASGLLVGDAYGIEENDFKAMRIAGTAHLIAISGMHIALISGLVFFTIKWILLRIDALSQVVNLKKYAALASICASYFYLMLAGSPVSAERAFLMSALVFLAVILDKEIDPMKSLGVAITALLVFEPENILNPSLQMSIAACIGLIAGFNCSHYLLIYRIQQDSILRKIFIYLFSVVFATIVAGTAVSIFIAFHFKQFSLYSIIANLIAVPINDFFIMPFGLLALVLMPFELEAAPLRCMDYGISALLYISHQISSLANANIYVPFFSKTPLILMTCGLITACICKTRLRYISIALVSYGIILLVNTKPPILLIAESSNLFALFSGKTLTFSERRTEHHVQKVWIQSLGAINVKALPKKGTCTNTICHYHYKDSDIVIVKDEQHFLLKCKEGVDLFVNLFSDTPCQLASHNITFKDLQKRGSHAVWLDDQVFVIKSVR